VEQEPLVYNTGSCVCSKLGWRGLVVRRIFRLSEGILRSFSLFWLDAGRQLVKACAQQFAFPPCQTPGSLSVMATGLEGRFVPAFNEETDLSLPIFTSHPPTPAPVLQPSR